MDHFDSLTGRRHDLVPPRRMIDAVGPGGPRMFKQVGESFVRTAVSYASLGKHERLLEVGCGCGRMAIPLTKYLSSDALYEGFDIGRNEIAWCTEHITSRFPNFRFRFADVFNGLYNRAGTYSASEYKFPYQDGQFDFILLASVFTHMLPDEVRNYLSEISRVLREGGRCWITFFLLNEESRELIQSNQAKIRFSHPDHEFSTAGEAGNESVVAYDEGLIRKLHREEHLGIQEPIRYGSWCGRKNFFGFQDEILAHRLTH